MSIEYTILNWICIPNDIKNKLRPVKKCILNINGTFLNFNKPCPYNYDILAFFLKHRPKCDLYIPISGILGRKYMVSIKGFVYDVFLNKPVKPQLDHNKNVVYFLRIGKRLSLVNIKFLVALTFFPELAKYRSIHIDGNKNNNCIFNLKFIGMSKE